MIKIISPSVCPHCGKNILISQKFITPIVDWVLKEEDVDKTKQDVIDQVNKADFKDATEKKLVLDWLTREDTIFGPEEKDEVLKQIFKQNDNPEANKTA